MRKPRSWWLPLTYKPKIQGVIEGKYRQTIRPGVKYQIGDRIAFHGWEGKPYRSKWSFRTGFFILKMAINVTVYCRGIGRVAWKDLNYEAALDGIDPPTGEELGRVLRSMHKIPVKGIPFQILRW